MVNYYASSTQANATDSGPGTLAQPYKTLAKLQTAPNPGDTAFMQGEFREDLVPLRNGSAGSPITYTSYPNETAIVSALDLMTGWTLHSGNIWRTAMSWNLNNATQLGGNNQLFYRPNLIAEPILIPEARWPLIPSSKRLATLNWQDLAIVDSAVAGTGAANAMVTSVITDADLAGLPDVVGGFITFFGGPAWVAISGTITAQTSTTLSVQHPYRVGFHLKATNWYYIYGHPNLIAQGYWYRGTDGFAYVWMPDNSDPNGWVMEGKRRDKSLDLFKNNLIVTNLKVYGGRSNGSSAASANNRIENVYMLHAYQRMFYDSWYNYLPPAINATGAGSVVLNCTIKDSASPGIEAASSRVEGCLIENISYGGASGAAIKLTGTGCVCINNVITGGGSARQIDVQCAGSVISGNDLSKNSRLLTDEGPIFGWRGTDGGVNKTKIFNNYIHDSEGRQDDTHEYYQSSLYFENVLNFEVYRNRCKANGGIALVPATGASQLVILLYNNTIDNSIFWQNVGFNYTGTIIRNNALTRISVKVGGTIRSDIVFTDNATSQVSYTNNKFFADWLTNANLVPAPNSPLIDAGVEIPPYTNGFSGAAPDIGAIEYVPPLPTFDLLTSLAGYRALKVPRDELTELALLYLLANR